MRMIETHFTDTELKCKCGCGKDVDPRLPVILEALRLMCNFPLSINSGARCPEHNAKNGGAATSRHLLGLAVDIECKDSLTRFEIIENALRLGFNGLGISDEFLHLDLRPYPERKCWKYKK